MNLKTTIGLAVLLLAGSLGAEMVQGGGFSFFLSAPAGWVLDKKMAADNESDALLYPQGTTYQNAPSVLYVSVAVKGDGFKDLKDLMRQDADSARQQNPGFRLQNGPFLYTRLKKIVPLYLFLGFKDGTAEAVVYVEEPDAVVVFTLSASNEQVLHEDLPALQESVASYEFIGKTGGGLE
jgi:hypothetical protein